MMIERATERKCENKLNKNNSVRKFPNLLSDLLVNFRRKMDQV